MFRTPGAAALVFLSLGEPAFAQSAEHVGDYLNLSFTGDGETPSGLERLAQAAQRAPAPLAGSLATSASGDATYAVPIALPPARLSPTVTLSYSSGGGLGRQGRGWSIDLGPTIRDPIGREAGAYDDVPGVWLVQGGGFSGLLVPLAAGYRWVSTIPGAVDGSYDSGTNTWTLRRDGITWTLSQATLEYHAVSQVDGSGNRVDYDWSGRKIAQVRYGSTAEASHFLGVEFAYVDAAHVLREGRGGVLDVVTDRLSSISVQTSFGHADDLTRIRYDLWYDVDDELLLGVTQTEVHPDGTDGAVREVASFEYTTLSDDWEETDDPPARLTRSSSLTPWDAPSVNTTWTALVDASGDGLPDHVSAMFGEWDVGWQRLDRYFEDPDLVVRWWEDPDDEAHVRPFDDAASGALDESTTVVLLEEEPPGVGILRGTYAVRRFEEASDGRHRAPACDEPHAIWSPLERWARKC